MTEATRRRLRATFEEVPELYDRARPGYPPELFDDLVWLCGLEAGDAVVEIGPGTGKATRPLAERGLRVTGVELGAGLAEQARANLRGCPGVDIVVADFEHWAPGREFAAVTAFTAFHWLDPQRRYAAAARALRERGALAVVETQHVLLPGGDAFWAEVQADYDAVVPSEDNRPPPPPEEVPTLEAEIAASELFEPLAVRRYTWDVVYDAREYLAVLDTYSGHRAMPEPARLELYERIRRRIDSRPGRRVSKTYLATLNVARRT